jgi:hypothetical protein
MDFLQSEKSIMKTQGLKPYLMFVFMACLALAVTQTSSSQEPKEKNRYRAYGADPYAEDELEAAEDQVKQSRKQVEVARKQAEKQMHEARKQAEAARKDAEKQWMMQNDKFKFVFSSFGREGHAELRKAAEAVRDAEDDEDRGQAESKLRELLEDSFDEDMERRKESLIEMESRLKKLQRQLERRREKMEEIVDLQMKVLVNEADGLGFFSGGPSTFEVPVITNGRDDLFAPTPDIPYQQAPARITAPLPVPTYGPLRVDAVVPAQAAATAAAPIGVPPAPPLPEDEGPDERSR